MTTKKGPTPEAVWAYINERSQRQGDCLLWQRAVTGGMPTAHLPDTKGTGTTNLRRWVLEQTLGRAIEPGKVATYTCSNERCLSPAHLAEWTRKQLQQRAAALGKFSSETFRAGQRRAGRTRLINSLTEESVRFILEQHRAGVAVTTIAKAAHRNVRVVRRVISGELLAVQRGYPASVQKLLTEPGVTIPPTAKIFQAESKLTSRCAPDPGFVGEFARRPFGWFLGGAVA